MLKKISFIFLISCFSIIFVACGSKSLEVNTPKSSSLAPEEVILVIEHELGETKVKKNPEKVVVFDFGVLDSLDKMGIEVAGVAQNSIPPYLSKYEDSKYENIGSLKEPDFEKISKMKPNVILISGRQAEAYEELSKIAPTIYLAVDNNNYLESFTENMLILGKIFDKEAFIENELAQINSEINKLKEQTKDSSENALIVLVNGGKISAYGPKSRFGIIHDLFGVHAVDKNIEVSTHGMSVSYEYIMEKDPDYLFVVDRDSVVEGDSSAKQVLENDLIKNTKAYKNGTIIYLDPNYWYLSGGGLVSVSEMVTEINEAINK